MVASSRDEIVAAAATGQLNLLKDLFRLLKLDGENMYGWYEKCINAACVDGHVEVVQWLLRESSDIGISFDDDSSFDDLDDGLIAAASNGHYEIIQALPITPNWWVHAAQLAAIQHDHLDILISLYERTGKWFSMMTMDEAATCGNLGIVQWIFENGEDINEKESVECAARHGHLEIVKFFCENGEDAREGYNIIDVAAENNHLHIVQWAYTNTNPTICTTAAMDKAAGNGHLKVVKWLHFARSEGCTTAAMDNAYANGHFDVVVWLHTNRREGCSSSQCAAFLQFYDKSMTPQPSRMVTRSQRKIA